MFPAGLQLRFCWRRYTSSKESTNNSVYSHHNRREMKRKCRALWQPNTVRERLNLGGQRVHSSALSSPSPPAPNPSRHQSFPMNQLFTWGSQSIGASALASVLPMNTQDWSPLGWTGWILLQTKGLSRVFSNTTVQKHQFFGAQLSSQSYSHIHTWPQEKP